MSQKSQERNLSTCEEQISWESLEQTVLREAKPSSVEHVEKSEAVEDVTTQSETIANLLVTFISSSLIIGHQKKLEA